MSTDIQMPHIDRIAKFELEVIYDFIRSGAPHIAIILLGEFLENVHVLNDPHETEQENP